jgi:hypothetical protein
LTLRVYAHALREEEADLGFLEFGDDSRHETAPPRHRVANNGLNEKAP